MLCSTGKIEKIFSIFVPISIIHTSGLGQLLVFNKSENLKILKN